MLEDIVWNTILYIVHNQSKNITYNRANYMYIGEANAMREHTLKMPQFKVCYLIVTCCFVCIAS